MNKAIRKVTDRQKQKAENFRYWQGLSVGDRLSAVCQLSVDAYAMKGIFRADGQRPERILVRVKRP